MNQAGAARRTSAQTKKAKPVIILRNVPKGYNWGWYSREDPRMHLQTVDGKNLNKYKVWLERDGRRVFETERDIPRAILKALEAEVRQQRRHIEGRWTNFMIKNAWLSLHMRGRDVTLTAYPQFPGARFVRTFDIADYHPARYDPIYPTKDKSPIKPEDVILSDELPAVEVWPHKHESLRDHIYIPTILWKD